MSETAIAEMPRLAIETVENVAAAVRQISIRQVHAPCPECGSWYRRGDLCNICKTFAPVARTADKRFSREGHAPIGRVWNKSTHKYNLGYV